MTRLIVGYGLGSGYANHVADEEARARTWALNNAAEVVLWRRDGREVTAVPLQERTRLHHALFMIRADLADDLWLPRRAVLGDNCWNEALVVALVEAKGGRVLVDGERLRLDRGTLESRVASTWVSELENISPRRREDGPMIPADLGVMLGDEPVSRLAHKLYEDLHLTDREIAGILEFADYSLPGGESYTPSNVNRVRRLHDPDAGQELAKLWFGQEGPLAEKLVCSYGPDAAAILSRLAASAYDPQRLVPVVEDGEPRGAASVLSGRRNLASLLGVLVLFGEVHVSTFANLYSDSPQQSLVRAFVRRQQVDIYVEGRHTSIPASERPGQDEAAGTAVALHAILRAHDEGTVADDRLHTAAARQAARGWMREYEGLVYREIAHKLNAANFPTRGRHGRWHESSARELVCGEEQ